VKKLLIALLLMASALIAWGLGERQPAWGQSPIVTPVVYLPIVLNKWDGTPAPTPTPTPAPTPTPLPKFQGVGHHRQWDENEADWLCPYLELSGVATYYDWTPYPIQCSSVEAVPMIWDETQINIPAQGNSEYLQVFSEPDFESQANLTPLQGAQYYRQVEQLYPNMKLVSPAVVYISWLENFWSEYVNLYGEEPRMDVVAIHFYPQLVSYYGSASTLVSISQSKLNQAIAFAELHDIPEVWAAEFSVQPLGDLQRSIGYMQGMVDIFESEPLVTRWFWFGLDLTGFWYWPTNPELSALYDTSLVHSNELTSLGTAYLETQ
jgi:hypothetical protein